MQKLNFFPILWALSRRHAYCPEDLHQIINQHNILLLLPRCLHRLFSFIGRLLPIQIQHINTILLPSNRNTCHPGTSHHLPALRHLLYSHYHERWQSKPQLHYHQQELHLRFFLPKMALLLLSLQLSRQLPLHHLSLKNPHQLVHPSTRQT